MNEIECLNRLKSVVGKLRVFTPQQFYDEEYSQYHPIRKEIAILVHSLEIDTDVLAAFLEKHPQNAGWLPDTPVELDSMLTIEVYCRLFSNILGDRWVDGALLKPFRSGSLTRALEIVIERPIKFVSRPFPTEDKDSRNQPEGKNNTILEEARALVNNRRWAAETLMRTNKGHFMPLNTLLDFASDDRGVIHVCWVTLAFRDDYIYITIYDRESFDIRHALVRISR